MGLKAISQSSFVERMEVGNGHFHLQSAFQNLNTVCPVRLTGLSVETLPGSFATETVGYTFSLHLQASQPRQRQGWSSQQAILQTNFTLKVRFNQTKEYSFKDARQKI